MISQFSHIEVLNSTDGRGIWGKGDRRCEALLLSELYEIIKK